MIRNFDKEIIKIEGIRNEKGGSTSFYFHFLNRDLFIKEKKYVFDLNSVSEENILIMFSGINEFFYKPEEEINEVLEKSIYLLKDKSKLQSDLIKPLNKLEYFIISKNALKELEPMVYEFFNLFYFTTILGIKEVISIEIIENELKKWRFRGVNNYKRWKGLVNWFIYIDFGHDGGECITFN